MEGVGQQSSDGCQCGDGTLAEMAATTAAAAVGGGAPQLQGAGSMEESALPSASTSGSAALASPDSKPFLGGYRNPASGTQYHHAAMQTEALPRPQPAEQASCATQVAHPRSKAVQCSRDAGTQCPRPGWAEDRSQCRVLEPSGPYVSAAEVTWHRESAALTIQRWVRGWLARRATTALRQAQEDLRAFVAQQEAQHVAEEEQQRQFEMRRRMQPRTPADFLLLYDELAVWWGQEQARIAAAQGWTDEQRLEARRALLAKETKLLQTIDLLKLAAAPVVKAQRTAKHLAAMAAPKQWQLGAQVVEVATPDTLRAGELGAAYQALAAADGANLDARLSALLVVKYLVKAFDCSLTREIVGLVDREADLLNRGRDPSTMAGLRVRLANRFLEFVKDERFNPAAARVQG